MWNVLLAQIPEASFFSRQDRTKMMAWNAFSLVFGIHHVCGTEIVPQVICSSKHWSGFWFFLLAEQTFVKGCSCWQGQSVVFEMEEADNKRKVQVERQDKCHWKGLEVLRWLTHLSPWRVQDNGAGRLRLQRQVSFPSLKLLVSSSAGWAASVSLAAAATDKSLQKHQRTVPSRRTCWVLSSGSTFWPWSYWEPGSGGLRRWDTGRSWAGSQGLVSACFCDGLYLCFGDDFCLSSWNWSVLLVEFMGAAGCSHPTGTLVNSGYLETLTSVA